MKVKDLNTDHPGDKNLTLVGVRYTRGQFVLVNELLSSEDDFQAAQAFVRIVAASHELISTNLQQSKFEMSRPAITIRITIPAFRTNL